MRRAWLWLGPALVFSLYGGYRGWAINSSLTREDTGPGACQITWVESFD